MFFITVSLESTPTWLLAIPLKPISVSVMSQVTCGYSPRDGRQLFQRQIAKLKMLRSGVLDYTDKSKSSPSGVDNLSGLRKSPFWELFFFWNLFSSCHKCVWGKVHFALPLDYTIKSLKLPTGLPEPGNRAPSPPRGNPLARRYREPWERDFLECQHFVV